jgi:hypothetical protein
LYPGLPLVLSSLFGSPGQSPATGASPYVSPSLSSALSPNQALTHLLESILGSGAALEETTTGMSENPEECRLRALECVRLAQTSATRQGRDHFAKLARTWIRLAEDLGRRREFLDENEIERTG